MSVLSLKLMVAQVLGLAIKLDQPIRMGRERYVLAYHRVISERQADNDGVHNSLWISPGSLELQIRWMLNVGEIVDCSCINDTSIPNDKPWFALTFDDGWKDNYEQAFPILKKYQIPALIFLATAAVNSGALFWPEDISTKTRRCLGRGCETQVRTALHQCWPEDSLVNKGRVADAMSLTEQWIEALKLVGEDERWQRISDYFGRLRLSETPLTGYIMNWDNAREMQKSGIAFGSHSHHHTILKGLPKERIEYELSRSKELITDKLQTEVDSFCYPNARYNGKEGEILSQCGYRYGFRLDNRSLRHCTDPYYIPRFLVSERDAVNDSSFKLRLLEVPFYSPKPHNPHAEEP